LWLMKLNEGAHINLTNHAISHGINPNRIVYATRLPRIEDHLARYRLANVFLDTYPYNGHTTAGDALRASLPVVSMMGTSFASRVASSLLHDLDLKNCVCDDFVDYKNTVIELLNRPKGIFFTGQQITQKIEKKQWPISDERQLAAFASVFNEMENSKI